MEGQKPVKSLKVGYLYHGTDVNFAEPFAVQLHIYHQIRNLQEAGHNVNLLGLQGRRALCTGNLRIFEDQGPSDSDFGDLGFSGGRFFKSMESMVRRLQRELKLPYLALFDGYRIYDACLRNLACHDLLHERHNLLAFGGALASRKLGIPYVLEVNADLLEERRAQGTPERGFRRIFAMYTTRLCLDTAERIICVSSQLKDHLSRKWKVMEEKIVVLPNAADTEAFQKETDRSMIRRQLGLGDEPVVMFVGGFYLWHDLELLVQSFSDVLCKFPTAKLVLVGDGRNRVRIEKFVASIGIEAAVMMVGPVKHCQVPEMLAIATIAVAPNIPFFDGHGGSPLKIFEYMAAGKPIVATRTGQVAEIIQDGQNGILVDTGDRQGLAEAMVRLLGDGQLRDRLSRQARRQALEHHSWKQYVQQLEGIYSSALQI